MKQAFEDVAAFHRACDIPCDLLPSFPPSEREKLRIDLMQEEYKELFLAIKVKDLPEIADAIADLIYVLIGTAHEYGISLPHVWNAVHAANMAKVDPATGKVIKREDGKVLKPHGWTPPDIARAMWGP